MLHYLLMEKALAAGKTYEEADLAVEKWAMDPNNDYTDWFDWLADRFNVKPKGFIYLRASPEISFERIKKRSRSGEETIPFEYLKELHNKHENWLMDEPNVLVLDVNEDFENNPDKLSEMIQQVLMFIKKYLIITI